MEAKNVTAYYYGTCKRKYASFSISNVAFDSDLISKIQTSEIESESKVNHKVITSELHVNQK